MHHLKTNPFSDKCYHEYLSNYNGFPLVSLQKNQLCMHINHWLCLLSMSLSSNLWTYILSARTACMCYFRVAIRCSLVVVY